MGARGPTAIRWPCRLQPSQSLADREARANAAGKINVRLSAILLARIVAGIQIFEAQRTNGRDLGDVLAGLCPVEVPSVAGQNDDAAGRISLQLIAVEPLTEADIENAGHHRV